MNFMIALLISILVFLGLNGLIKLYDKESDMYHYNRKEKIVLIICMLLQSIFITLRFDSLLDISFFSIFVSILLMHAHTDFHTKYVYRLFSYIMWLVGILYNITKLYILDTIPSDKIMLFLSGTILFIAIMLVGSVFTGFIHGKGDGYILIGCALFLQFTTYSNWGIEPILWHYILSVVILVITNIKKINWTKKKMKEKIPFSPSLYIATLLVIHLTGINMITDALLKIAI